jgi:hypothetical protein
MCSIAQVPGPTSVPEVQVIGPHIVPTAPVTDITISAPPGISSPTPIQTPDGIAIDAMITPIGKIVAANQNLEFTCATLL